MPTLTRTAQFRPLAPLENRHVTAITDVETQPGQAVYMKANGRLALASAAAAGTAGVIGIATRNELPGRAVEAMWTGKVAGYDTLESIAPGTVVYLGNTPGTLDTTAGTVRVPVGVVLHDTRLQPQERAYILLFFKPGGI